MNHHFEPRDFKSDFSKCWLPSMPGEDFSLALQLECRKIGLSGVQESFVAGRALSVFDSISAEAFLNKRLIKPLAMTSGQLFELRIETGIREPASQLRVYLHLDAERLHISGVMVRFKDLTGTRQEIRDRQNTDIFLAVMKYRAAAKNQFQNCVEFGGKIE